VTIQGIDNMSLDEVEAALRKGACFVFYEYCISVGVITLRRPSDVYFLPVPAGGLPWRFAAYLTVFVLVLCGLVGGVVLSAPEAKISLAATAFPALGLLLQGAWWSWKTYSDGSWRDATGLKRGAVFSLVSLLLGWWGVPWGLIWTPMTIFTNLSGGQDVTDEVWALLQASAQ
jgi:hypothetical protein